MRRTVGDHQWALLACQQFHGAVVHVESTLLVRLLGPRTVLHQAVQLEPAVDLVHRPARDDVSDGFTDPPAVAQRGA
ncbi:hypothetical protein [Streptomyces sp. NPDC058964]|uniref:hypothetical protein n=1 Tax=Streptomyces sp. NPDC058964 TaxID=3346681 RepID=UPI00369FA0CD